MNCPTFFPCRLHLFGCNFQSSEAAYQYRKALHFNQWQQAEEILLCQRASDAKAIGDKINNTIMDDTWLAKRMDIMLEILEAKASQCPSFKNRLLQTGKKELVENTTDEFWARGHHGDGRNQLGVLLMLLRQKLAIQPIVVESPPKHEVSRPISPSFHVVIGKRILNRNAQYTRSFKTQNGNSDNRYRCNYCKEYTHSTNICAFRGPVQCRQCNQLGHKQKFCSEFRP